MSATYLVCYGNDKVELHKAGLTLEEANIEADLIGQKGKKNVRIRMEDPSHPTWPLHFDAERSENAK